MSEGQIWRAHAIIPERDDDLESVLRTLRLAKAQIRLFKKRAPCDASTTSAIGDIEMALEIIIKKLCAGPT